MSHLVQRAIATNLRLIVFVEGREACQGHAMIVEYNWVYQDIRILCLMTWKDANAVVEAQHVCIVAAW